MSGVRPSTCNVADHRRRRRGWTTGFAGACCLVLLAQPAAASEVAAGPHELTWIEGHEAGLIAAGQTGHPALVYFQADWCSWCRRYEATTLADPGVQALVRDHYTPVLVDYDARPDLLADLGGFGLPFTVVVTPDGRVLARLPGMLSAEDMRDRLDTVAAATTPEPTPSRKPTVTVDTLDCEGYLSFRAAWLELIDDLYDEASGVFSGFLDSGAGLKRPFPLAWRYLLRQGLWPERGRNAARALRERLHDPVDGGFFYYQDPNRADGHLETAKLLEANAWLALWFAEAGLADHDEQLLVAAREAFGFLLDVLYDHDEGGFRQARLADADYYRLPPTQRRDLPAPALDPIKRVDSNAQTVLALLAAADRLAEPALASYAGETLDYLLEHHWQDGHLLHSRRTGRPGPAVDLPEDLLWLLLACQALQQRDTDSVPATFVHALSARIAEWLDSAMATRLAGELPLSLLGLIALAVDGDLTGRLPPLAAPWALAGLRLDPASRPDDVVPALQAWRRWLDHNGGCRPSGVTR